MRARPDVNCVIHTHPEHAVAFSSLGKELQPISNDGTMFSAGVPDLLGDHRPDHQPGARQGRWPALGDKSALILRNHGIVTAGSTIEHAVFVAIKLEKACRIQMLAEQAGGPKLFVRDEELAAKRSRTNRNDSQGNAVQLSGPALACALRLRGAKGIQSVSLSNLTAAVVTSAGSFYCFNRPTALRLHPEERTQLRVSKDGAASMLQLSSSLALRDACSATLLG